MDLSSFYNQFRDETTENVRALSDGLLALEGLPSHDDPAYREHVNSIFRAVHTIKGSARMLGFETVGRLAHTMEHILASVREGQRRLDTRLANDMLRGGDALLELTHAAVEGRPTLVDIDALTNGLGRGLHPQTNAVLSVATAPPTPPSDVDGEHAVAPPAPFDDAAAAAPIARSAGRPAATRQTVRVRVDRLDRLINLTGELAIAHQVQTSSLQILEDLQNRIVQQERMIAEITNNLERLSLRAVDHSLLDQRVGELWSTTKQMRQMLHGQTERLTTHSDQHRLLIDDLQREVMGARLLPVATVLAALPRAVRELSATLGKEVALVVSGEATELDRKLLEAITDPLLHLVRNAIDHGIESPAERRQAGKASGGTVKIIATAVGSEVRIAVSDDGRGISPSTVRNSAVRKGLISQQAADLLSDHDVLDLLFLPGFSTTAIVTDISGRGVGLDVVRTNIGDLGGQTQIESQPGHGTTIMLVLPLTLVTTRVLLVELGDVTYGLPVSGCSSIIWTSPSMIHAVEGHPCISYGERTIPLVRLADLLGVASALLPQGDERRPTVVIGNGQRLLALIVDRLVDEREVVVKPLGPIFEGRRRYAGALQLGDGQLVLLLNPIMLAQEAHGLAIAPRRAVAAPVRASLLVVDDSFTTRELIRSILQSAGYEITVAVDGADALEKLRQRSFELVVSDVEMPQVDGFQLTSRIRRELGLIDMPVIIMTSLASDEHKRQGLEAGAQGYIVKSQFNQDNLIGTIRQLLGR